MDAKTKLKLVALVSVLLVTVAIVLVVFATEGDYIPPGSTGFPDLGNGSSESEFLAWCTDATIQTKLSQVDETFNVTGNCRKTEAADGTWSLNCNLTPTTMPEPMIHASSYDPTTGKTLNATCKFTPKTADTYKLNFVKSSDQMNSSLTHYKLSGGLSQVPVYWANATEMQSMASETDASQLQPILSASQIRDNSTENENSTIILQPFWDRSKCFKVLPECLN